MLATELLMQLTRIFFVTLAALTTYDFIRHRDRVRRDIALVFVSLSSTTIISVFLSFTGLQLPWLLKIGQIGIISQPYLLLRLVAYFRAVPLAVRRAAFIGWILSSLVIIFVGTPIPPPVTLPIILYFIVINGYSVFGFVRSAFSSEGVARHRLQFAAAGSALLVILFIIAGLRIALPTFWPDISAAVQILAMLTVLTYYLGFAPPRWLRQGWQFNELRNYLLQDISTLESQTALTVMASLRKAVMHAVGTDMVFVALWDQDSKKLVLEDIPQAAALKGFNLNDGIIKEAWQKTRPTVIDNLAKLSENDAQIIQLLKAEMLFIVPIATDEGAVGVLLVFLEFGSLFVEDDLNLLAIFAQQTAILLENYRVLEQQRSYSQVLEHTVEMRTEALKRSNDELRQFAYVASHDLQEPLRMVVSYLQLIEERYISQLDSGAHEFFAFATDGAKRMKSLIEALLAYSRVDTQLQNFTPVDFQKVLNDVRSVLSVAISESGAAITSDPLPNINANEAMIVQLFQNLLSNAIKYQKGTKPEIHISAEYQNNEWVFSVKDNGIGIEPHNLERIFVIFQRLHAQNEYPGTGIGLAISKKVVEHHGGRIESVK
ncbi:MAG: hypothetical protein GC179_30215 [Anaerolineaceae bacterium]|nr:hypothetical protein [Anaerolineaceae bacterium]